MKKIIVIVLIVLITGCQDHNNELSLLQQEQKQPDSISKSLEDVFQKLYAKLEKQGIAHRYADSSVVLRVEVMYMILAASNLKDGNFPLAMELARQAQQKINVAIRLDNIADSLHKDIGRHL